MKNEKNLEKGLYFVHGYYTSGNEEEYIKKLYHDQMILMKDSMDNIYDIEAYDVNLREMRLQNQILQGEFVIYDGESIHTAEDDPTSIMYTELNKQLISIIGYENYGNRPEEISEEISEQISDVHSYHVNVGHGNCSIIVFCSNRKYNMWMVDCSVFDFTDKNNYCSNLNVCMHDIEIEFGVRKISKLLITHLHYDHINGIEYLIKKRWIDKETQVWMNIQYPWKQPTYNRILLQLKALGVKFIDPIVCNSTRQINILYPDISFNKKNAAPNNNINNASVLYQICLDGKSMLFTGDIEVEGWEQVRTCYPYLNQTTYYCISHHGSITGHRRNHCAVSNRNIWTLADCADSSKKQVLMGRDHAYKGIFSQSVISDFNHILKTEDAKHYIEVDWHNDGEWVN